MMADFPSKVTTETAPPGAPGPPQGGLSLGGLGLDFSSRINVSFLRSVPALLMVLQSVLGLLHWALIAGAPYTLLPAYGWVMFVAVTLWILTTVLFFIILFRVHLKIDFLPWTLTLMSYHVVAALLYATAFLANAASVHPFRFTIFYGHFAAAAFFGAVVTLAYAASAFFSYLDWRGEQGNAATNTVPT